MKSGEMDFNRPKTLISFVTEKGSGSKVRTSYDPLRRVWGQIKPSMGHPQVTPATPKTLSVGHPPRFRGEGQWHLVPVKAK